MHTDEGMAAIVAIVSDCNSTGKYADIKLPVFGPALTARENIELKRSMHKTATESSEIEEMADSLGIQSILQQPAGTCSYGEQQRIAIARPCAIGAADVRLGSWWGKGLPSRRSVAGLRERPATLGLRHGPDSYGRQQWGILDNGRKPDPAMPRAGRRPSGCKLLLYGTK